MLDVEEVDDILHRLAVLQFFLLGAAEPVERAGEEVVLQQVVAAHQDVVQHAHVVEQRQVLEGAADADGGALVRLQPGDVPPSNSMRPSLGE